MFIFELFHSKTNYRITDLTDIEIDYFYTIHHKYRRFKSNNLTSDDNDGFYLVRSGSDG